MCHIQPAPDPTPHSFPQNGMPARGLVILPYLSIVQEKADHLSFILGALGCSVKGYTGGLDEHTPLGVGCVKFDMGLLQRGFVAGLCCRTRAAAPTYPDPGDSAPSLTLQSSSASSPCRC